MSATVAYDSLERLAGWLDARLFVTNYRPVPLEEHVVAGDCIFARVPGPRVEAERETSVEAANDVLVNVSTKRAGGRRPGFRETRFVPEILSLETTRQADVSSNDCVAVQLVAESARAGHSCLVFCPSRNKTEAFAKTLTRAFASTQSRPGGDLGVDGLAAADTPGALVRFANTPKTLEARRRLRRKLLAAAEGRPDEVLLEVTRVGVAYHHAHMRAKEKEAIEEGFRDGALIVLACTTTLAAGVNLPARRVLIVEGQHPIKPASYRQMAGRAGRAGHAERGEAFVIPIARGSVKNEDAAFELVSSGFPALVSRMLAPAKLFGSAAAEKSSPVPSTRGLDGADDVQPLAALALQCISAGTFRTARDGHELLRSTFAFGVPANRPRLGEALDAALRHLRDDEGLIETEDDPRSGVRRWRATNRGEAAHGSALPLRHASVLYDDLFAAARNGVFLEGDDGEGFGRLHALFLCAPRGGGAGRGHNPFESRFDWAAWYETLAGTPALRDLGAKLGVEVAHARRARATGGGGGTPANAARLEKHKRFAAAAALRDALEGGDLVETARRWSIVAGGTFLPGTLQRLQAETAATAAMGANLAATAGWRGVAELLNAASRELDAGASRELAALTAVARDTNTGWTMTVARARALYKAGFTTPGAVLEAGEEHVRAAVARADARRRGGTGPPTDALGGQKPNDRFPETSSAASAYARRAARELLEACRLFETRRFAAATAAHEETDAFPSRRVEENLGGDGGDARTSRSL